MKKILSLTIFIFIVIFLCTAVNTNAAYNDPYYSQVDTYASGGSGGNDPYYDSGSDEGQDGLFSVSGMMWWCEVQNCGVSIESGDASGWAEISTDPVSGSMQARSGAFHRGPEPAEWIIDPSWTTPYLYTPDDWGTAYAFGYTRSVWNVASYDGSLEAGDPVILTADYSVEGYFEGDPNSLMRAMVLLNRTDDVSWLDYNNYLGFGGAEDLGLMTADNYYAFSNTGDDDIDYSNSYTIDAAVGDTVMLETLFSVSSTLPNNGMDMETWAKFDNTLYSSVTADTPGAAVVSVVPEPVSSVLFITGGATLGMRNFRKKRKLRLYEKSGKVPVILTDA